VGHLLPSLETAIEPVNDNIRCNPVHPSGVETPMIQDASGIPGRRDRTLMGQRAGPSEIAYGALYLASDELSLMTGSELVINGGRSAQ
jgi:NAD(P)-dependent dehydrogenase (short-subunit alcohol dehydrogenase family)